MTVEITTEEIVREMIEDSEDLLNKEEKIDPIEINIDNRDNN